MASLFSTATLGLRLDTASFNSALQAAGRTSRTFFDGLSNGANQFKESWDDATRGIKDTKRIISGILISQGFYAIMNGLTDAGSAALTFSMNMETAAVSMEYFMQGADKAAKATAYLREMKDFAARTPFSTEAALELSKYTQAVGIGTQYTKSFLSVVTDAAAATGATTENLERVVFALGQMKTKGRIANEEIRQLANANIPIYEILQEELGLTGDQISNIGKYWVDADKAIVAILTGLNKRYGGAADRISDTVTGMLDTISDDALIIAQEAGSDIYDVFANTLTKIRDKLDEYRDVATEMGGFGLLNHIMLDIDPSGEFGTELLVLIGNVQQLMSALHDLYISSQPVIKLFGKGLYSGINTATIIMTAFSRTIEGVEKSLEKLGVTSGTLGTTLGKLYVMYQAGKWALTLGQAAAYAGTSMFNMGSSVVTGLVPALNAGSVSAAGLLGNLLALAAVAGGIYMLLSSFNSFAGLDVSTGEVFPTDYEAAMNDYLAAMEEYNAQIAQYQSSFNSPFTEMTDGSDAAIEALDNTAKASKKAAGSVKNDWVAAFDEVYQVPTDNGGGGAGSDLKLPDLGKLLTPPKFKFPSVGIELKKPELEDFFDGALLDDTTLNQDWFKGILPGLIAAGLLGAAAHFKKPNYDIDAKKGPKDATAVKDADVRKAAERIVKEIEALENRIKLQTEELKKALENNRLLNKSLEGNVGDVKLLQDNLKKLEAAIDKRNALTGDTVKAMPITNELKALRESAYNVANQVMALRSMELEQLLESGRLQGQALVDAQAELKQLNKSITSLDKLLGGAATSTTPDITQAFNTFATSIYKAFEQLDADRLSSGLVSGEQASLIRGISKDIQHLLVTGDELARRGAIQAGSGKTEAQRLYDYLEAIRKDMNRLNNKDVQVIGALGAAQDSVDAMSSEFRGTLSANIVKFQEESAKARQLLAKMQGDVTKMSDATAQQLVAAREALKAQREAERTAREAERASKEAARAAAERSRVAAMLANERDSSRFLSSEEAARIGDDIVAAIEEQRVVDLPDVFDAQTNLETSIDYIRSFVDDVNKVNAEGPWIFDTRLWYSLDQLLDDVRKMMLDYQHQTQADSLPEAFREALNDLEKVGGIDEKDILEFEQLFKPNSNADQTPLFDNRPHIKGAKNALELLSRALRDAVGVRYNLAGVYPEGSTGNALTESEASRLSFGLGSFEGGLGDIYARMLEKANPNFIAAIERSANADTEVAAAIGLYTHNLGLMASKMKWGANGAELTAGGYRWTDGETLLHIDGQLSLIRDSVGKLIPTTITSMAQHNIDALTSGAKYIASVGDTPIRTLPSSILRGVNPEAYARMGYQLSALNQTSSSSSALSVLNRDFILTADKHANALSRFVNAFKGAALHEPANMAPFSTENVNMFASSFPSLKEADAATKVEAYMRRVVLPTFGVPEYALDDLESAMHDATKHAGLPEQLIKLTGNIDFAALSDFFETFIVDYTANQLKALNSAGNIAAAREIQALLADATDMDGIADALGSFVKFSDKLTSLGGQVALINTNSSWRQIGKISKSTKGFVDNILKIQSSLDGYLSTTFRNVVDSAIAEYQFDIARAGTAEQIESTTRAFRDKLASFTKSLRNYADGSFVALLKGSTMTKDSVEVVASALETLAENPLAVDKVPMLVRSVIDNTNKLNSLIEGNATATKLTATLIRQLANDSEALLNTLGSINDIGATEYFEQLTAMSDRISRALKDGQGLWLRQFEQITPLVSGLGAADSLEYYKDIISGADASKYALGALPQPEKTPIKYIVDTETTGLFSYSLAGTHAPNTLQVAYLDVETGSVGSFYVTRSMALDALGLSTIKQIPDVGDAWKTIGLEQFQTGAVPEAQVNATLKQLLGNKGVSGYNATNVNRLGGGYDYKIIADNFGYKLNAATDVMTQVADTFERTLGTRTTFKLSELAEIIAGAAPSAAHEAGADVKMTQFVMRNIANGRLEEIIQTAMINGINKGGLKDSLRLASSQLNKMGRLPDNLLGSSGLRLEFDVPGLPTNAASNVVESVPQPPIKQPILPAHVPEVDSRVVSETISEIFEPVTEASKLAGDAAEAAKAAGSNESIYSLIKQFFSSRFGGGNWDAFKDNFKTFRERVTNPFSSWRANAAGKGVNISIDDAYRRLYQASESLRMPELRQQWVAAQRDYTNKLIDDDTYVAARNAYNAALAEYESEAKVFFKTVTDQLSGAVSGFKQPADFATAISALSDSGDEFIAMLIDPKTGVPALLGDALHTSGAEVLDVTRRYAVNQLKAGGELADDAAIGFEKIMAAIDGMRKGLPKEEAIKFVGDIDDVTKELLSAFAEVDEVTRGVKSIDTLSDMAKKLHKAMNDFGSRVVITNVGTAAYTLNELGEAVTRLEEVRWAGESAKRGIETAADTVGTAFKSIGARLVNGVANFGILDVAAAGIQGGLQHSRDTAYKQYMQNSVSVTAADAGAGILASNGYNIGAVLGDEVFHGALQEFSFGIANGLASSLTITAVTPIVTSAISAKLGGAIGSIAGPIGTAVGIGVGVLAGALTDKAVEAMGGHTATNLYLDDYLKALDNGSLVTAEHLEDMAAALGMSTEEIASFNGNVGALTEALKSRYNVDVSAIEDRIKAQSTAIAMGSANYSNYLERDDINKLLYGRADSAKRDFYADSSKDDLSLRLIAGLNLIEGISKDTFSTGYVNATSNDLITTVNKDAVVRDDSGKLVISDAETHARLEELLGVNVEIRNLQSTVGESIRYGLFNADTGEAFTAGMSDADDLSEAIRLIYEQGNTGSDIAHAMDAVLSNNQALRQAVESSGGKALEMLGLVRDNLDGYISLYNSVAGTEFTRADINGNYQIGEAIMSWASKILEDSINQATAQMALARAHTEGYSTALLSEGAERMIWGGSLDGLSDYTIAALNEVGINLTEWSIEIGNTLTEAYEQSYLMLTTSTEKLAEHLAGFTLNPGSVDLEGLHITTQDAEILAQAGIQLTDAGATFMKPNNNGAIGAERDLALGSGAIAQDLKDSLTEHGINIDYSGKKSNLTLDTDAVTAQNIYGAMFTMPSGWDAKASKNIKKVFEKIGTVMDSGYVMITDKAILNGKKTIEEYVAGVVGDDSISDDVRAYFQNFDAIFQAEGDSTIENIKGWADAVVIPSFISKDDITPEIEAAFAAAGITFSEYGDEFLMIINEFGDHLNEWASRVDAETWNKLEDNTKQALIDMGVTWKKVGNQVMVDLQGAFEKGIDGVVTVFLDSPELWDEIPEEFQTLFSDMLFKTEDGFLALKNAGSTGLVNINGVWVTDMKNIRDDMIEELAKVNPEAAAELDNLRQTFNDGLFKIEGVFDEHDIPQLAENEIVIPFKDLPEEIQNSLTGPGGLDGNLNSALVVVSATAHEGFQGIVAEAAAGAAGVKTEADNLVRNISDAVVQAQLKVQELERLQKDANKRGGTIDVTNTYQGTLGNGDNTTVYAWNNTAGVQVGWYWYDEKGKVQYHKGLDKGATGFDSAPGGTTLVGELGREMAILPDGSIRMLGVNGKGELVDLPRGSQVLTNEDTEEVLKYTGNISSVRKLAEGNTELIVSEGDAAAQDSPEDDNFREIFLAFMKAFIAKFGGTVDDSDTGITAENYDSIDAAAHFVAENHAVAIRGYSAALFDILESWRNDKSGLEALGNKLDASIIDNAGLIVEAVQKADQDIVDAIRNISLRNERTSSFSSDYDYDFGEFDSSNLGFTWNDPDDDEPYNWLADVIQAQEMWANATTDAEREAAHAFAEAARATQGFSGGADGTQFIATGGAQADWVKEVFAAKAQYATATSDDERIAAHNRAEAARATQGFTGGITGSSFALTDSLENIIASMRLVQDNTDKTEENITTLNNDLETEIAEAMSKWSAQDLSTAELTNSTIIAGCDEVASAVGSYVSWSQSEINSLKSELSSMQLAANQAERSSASVSGSVKGSAKGSLVTEDALYRAGELGLNEAIIPLEQPSVMAMVGEAIADSMPEEEAAIILNNEQGVIAAITEQTEAIAVTIRGAVAAITENQANHKDSIIAAVEKIIATVDTDLKALEALETLGNLGAELSTLNESINAIGALLEASNGNIAAILESKATSADISMMTTALTAEFGQWWTNALTDARSAYYAADDDAGRNEAHARAEDIRALLGYSGGVDGSQVIPLARNGFSYNDEAVADILQQFSESLTEVTTSAWSDEQQRDKEETETQSTDMRGLTTITTDGIGTISTMLQTTGGSIISAIGSGASMVASAVGSYVSWSQREISSLRSELSSMQMAASQAERGSTSLSGVRGSASGSLVTEDALYRAGEGGLNEAIIPLEKPNIMSLVGSTIARYMPDSATVIMSDEESTIAAIVEQTETICVAIRGAMATIVENMCAQNLLLTSLNNAVLGNVSDNASKITSAVSNSKSSSLSLGSGWDTGPNSLLAKEAAAGTLRNAWPDYDGDLPLFGGGTSAGTKAQKYIDAGVKYSDPISVSVVKLNGTYKGSARGSLITKDALYRAGELGLNEAIIPLERPDVLTQVGAAIADFMPVEQRYAMGAAAGMTNGGIAPMGAPVVQEDPSMMASAITQSVLESVLPAMAQMQSDDVSDRRPLYVGTLIADERGLQTLERKLYDIRKMEATRR